MRVASADRNVCPTAGLSGIEHRLSTLKWEPVGERFGSHVCEAARFFAEAGFAVLDLVHICNRSGAELRTLDYWDDRHEECVTSKHRRRYVRTP